MPTRRLIISLLVVVTIGALFFMVGGCTAQRRAQAQTCAGRMFPLTFAARSWMDDTGTNRFPATLMYLSNEAPLEWLICPADHSRNVAADWTAFTPENSSYELVTPAIAPGDTNSVFLRCRVHGHLSYTDMTVFDGVRRRRKYD